MKIKTSIGNAPKANGKRDAEPVKKNRDQKPTENPARSKNHFGREPEEGPHRQSNTNE